MNARSVRTVAPKAVELGRARARPARRPGRSPGSGPSVRRRSRGRRACRMRGSGHDAAPLEPRLPCRRERHRDVAADELRPVERVAVGGREQAGAVAALPEEGVGALEDGDACPVWAPPGRPRGRRARQGLHPVVEPPDHEHHDRRHRRRRRRRGFAAARRPRSAASAAAIAWATVNDDRRDRVDAAGRRLLDRRRCRPRSPGT